MFLNLFLNRRLFSGRTWVPSALPGLFNALAFPPYCAEEMAPVVDSKNRAEHCSPIARLQTFWLNVTARCRRVVRSRSRTKIRWPLSNSRAALPLRLCLAKKARQERLEHPMTRTIKRAVKPGAGPCWGFRGGAFRYCGRHSHELRGSQRVGGTCSG